MRVDVVRADRTFRYRLELDADDKTEGRRGFSDAGTPFTLARREYRVELPGSFRSIHPDVHATAIWYVVRPLVGSQLALPFAVSERFAAAMLEHHRVRFPNVSAAQPPREAPEQARPALLFSGGMDSMAASVVYPADTDHLFLDRIAYPVGDGDALVDLARQRDACDAVAALGRPVHRTLDDHEHLFEPYPIWHSNMAPLSALYLCDSLGLSVVDGGGGLDPWTFGGYHRETPSAWKFQRPSWLSPASPGSAAAPVPALVYFEEVGLARAESIAGLSEVATTIVVAKSPVRGRSFSCYYRSESSFCMRCDKCFKKLLLRHIVDGEEVPAALFEGFFSIPRLAAIFERPYFDWHHIWYYLFQKIRCDHWFARELHAQAASGPDLSMLEKWYPSTFSIMPPSYRDEVRDNISKYVETMTAAEVDALEHLDVPPLHAPKRTGAVAVSAGGPAVAAPAAVALLAMMRTVLTVGPPPRWEGVALGELSIEPSRAAVRIALERVVGEAASTDADRLILTVERLVKPDAPCYARIGVLGVCHAIETPLDSAWRLAAADALVAHLEGVSREAAAAKGGRGRPARRGG